MDYLSSELTALVTVVIIDLVLAGDNAVVVGMAAAGLDPSQRRRAVVIGIAAAAVLRIIFALFTTQLLAIIGLLFAGGLLLLWVAWKLWREIRAESRRRVSALEEVAESLPTGTPLQEGPPTKTLRQATVQIIVADVSMSLDNVLAVAGTARDHFEVLVIGLVLSVALMGLAATLVARFLHRYHWISYVGFALITYVALRMIYDGGLEVFHAAERAGMV